MKTENFIASTAPDMEGNICIYVHDINHIKDVIMEENGNKTIEYYHKADAVFNQNESFKAFCWMRKLENIFYPIAI